MSYETIPQPKTFEEEVREIYAATAANMPGGFLELRRLAKRIEVAEVAMTPLQWCQANEDVTREAIDAELKLLAEEERLFFHDSNRS